MVLLDEVEKAHSEVFDILLQVLDDGRLTDGQGRTVDFRNAILILTSNLGSQFLADQTLNAETKRNAVMNVVRSSFKPEFLNRLDEIVLFDALGTEELARIVEINLKPAERPARRPADHRPGDRRGEGVAGPDRFRPGLRRPAAAPADPDHDRGRSWPAGCCPARCSRATRSPSTSTRAPTGCGSSTPSPPSPPDPEMR